MGLRAGHPRAALHGRDGQRGGRHGCSAGPPTKGCVAPPSVA